MTLRQIKKKYIRVYSCGEKKWATALVIDHQSFCVVQPTTKKRANWYAKMLAIALGRMLQNETAQFI